MEKSWRNVTIGLAGVFQSAGMVEQLAKTGYLDSSVFEISVRSVFEQTPESAEAVFGGLPNIIKGLELLIKTLDDQQNRAQSDVLRYTLGLFHLQKKLSRRKDMLDVVGARLDTASQQAKHFGQTHDNVIANLAGVYTDTISTFQYRIQVTGEYNYLQQTRVANQVRVLLLAGIRAATLWRQAGGNRWQFLTARKKIAAAANDLLQEAKRRQLEA